MVKQTCWPGGFNIDGAVSVRLDVGFLRVMWVCWRTEFMFELLGFVHLEAYYPLDLDVEDASSKLAKIFVSARAGSVIVGGHAILS